MRAIPPSAPATRSAPTTRAAKNAYWCSTPRKRGRRLAAISQSGCSSIPLGNSVAVAVDDAAAAEVVGGKLDLDPVSRKDPDPVAAHLAGGVAERLVAVVEGDAEEAVP